jgi:hypothetical protein
MKYRILREGEIIRATDEVLCGVGTRGAKFEILRDLELRCDMRNERVGDTWNVGEARRKLKARAKTSYNKRHGGSKGQRKIKGGLVAPSRPKAAKRGLRHA